MRLPVPGTVLFDVHDKIALLTFNRPEKLNALDYALIDELMFLLDSIEADPSIQAVILTGAGDRAFSAGGDIPEFARSVRDGVDVAVRDFVRRGQAMTARLEAFKKPIIAAVNGLAYGGGCEITEAAHLAIASGRAVSPSLRSISACRRPLAGRNGCRVSPAASVRWNCC